MANVTGSADFSRENLRQQTLMGSGPRCCTTMKAMPVVGRAPRSSDQRFEAARRCADPYCGVWQVVADLVASD
jgi:hypothetical protein